MGLLGAKASEIGIQGSGGSGLRFRGEDPRFVAAIACLPLTPACDLVMLVFVVDAGNLSKNFAICPNIPKVTPFQNWRCKIHLNTYSSCNACCQCASELSCRVRGL